MLPSRRAMRIFRRTSVVLIAVAFVLAVFGWVERVEQQGQNRVRTILYSGFASTLEANLLGPPPMPLIGSRASFRAFQAS